MTLKEFIQKLEKIAEQYGDSSQVLMADDIEVVDPIYFSDCDDEKKIVVITDQN